MVYCFGGAFVLLALEGIHNPPFFVPERALVALRVWKLRLRTEAHILTTLTGRACMYVLFGSILLADSGSWLGAGVGFYLMFVGFTMLYVSRSAIAKLKDVMPGACEADLIAKFDAHDQDRDGRIGSADLGALCRDLGTELTPREAESALLLLDTDGSGTIEQQEFLAWWAGTNWQRNLYSLV